MSFENDHVPVFERGNDEFHETFAPVVSAGENERMEHASFDIRGSPARAGDIGVDADP